MHSQKVREHKNVHQKYYFCLPAQKRPYKLRTSIMSRGDTNYFLASQTYNQVQVMTLNRLIQFSIATKYIK